MPQRIIEGGALAFSRFNRFSLQLLAWVARVRPDERRDVAGAFLTLFAFMTGHALLETARDALFLASLPATRLPWVYLTIALLALVLGRREPRLGRGLSAESELGRFLLVAAGVTAAFWFVVGRGEAWVLYGLYAWSGILASLVVVRFWTLLGSRFTVTQAKRVFPVIASGSVAGAILGSGLARVLTEVVDPRHLVLAAGGAFVFASTAPTVLKAQEWSTRKSETWGDFGEVTRAIWAGPYLRRVAALVLFATITFTLADFVFKSAAASYVAPEDLGEFFSTVYLSLNIVSLFVQILVVALILRVAGLMSAVSFVPAVILVATLGFAVGGGLALALVLKAADGTLRHSLYRTGTELLFIPLSDRLRTQAKGVIDVMGQRGGQALAAVMILMLLSVTSNLAVFAALGCLTATCWLVISVGLREHYLDLFRQALHSERGARGSGFPALDMASLETLMAALNTPDDRRVVAALDILEEQGKSNVVPAPLLYHPATTVVVRSLELFIAAGRTDVLPMVERLLDHSEPEARAASLRALSALAPKPVLLENGLNDSDLRVSSTARAALIACGWGQDSDHAAKLLDAVSRGDHAVQRAIAAALRVRPDPTLEPILLELLASDDQGVLTEAIRAASELGTPALVGPLIRLLARRAVRDEALTALAGFGPLALEGLSGALGASELPHSVRRHVPQAIALVGAARAPEILLRHLEQEPDGLIRFKVLRALGRWRKEQPGFPLDVSLLQGALGHAVSTGFRLMGWRHDLSSAARADAALGTELHQVLVALLRNKQDHALERVFRLLNLQSGSEEFQRIYRGLHSQHARSRAGSRELLQHMVLPPVRKPLMTLVDDLQGESGPADVITDGPEDLMRDYAAVLTEIVGCGMESASSLAVAHAVELRLVAVGDGLGSVRPLSPEHRRTLRDAGRALSAGSSA